MSDSLHPDFPVVTGDQALPSHWRVHLPLAFNRRIEDGSLVLWRPELTFWINIWNNDHQLPVDALYEGVRERASQDRSDEKVERGGAVVRFSYELPEEDTDRAISDYRSISGYVFSTQGYVQISAYYDTPEAHAMAYRVIQSIASGLAAAGQ